MEIDDHMYSVARRVRARASELPLPAASSFREGAASHRRRTGLLAGLSVVVVVATIAAVWPDLTDDDGVVGVASSVTPEDFTVQELSKKSSGLGEGSSFQSITSNRDRVILVGERPVAGGWEAIVWNSDDGRQWARANHPHSPGMRAVVGLDNAQGVLVGRVEMSDRVSDPRVWRSDDAGLTWTDVYEAGLDGAGPLPFRSVVHAFDRWNLSGTDVGGGGAIWSSADGGRWTATLQSEAVTRLDVINVGGGLLAIGPRSENAGSTLAYFSDDGRTWSDPLELELPSGVALDTIAEGGDVALARRATTDGDRSVILRSADGWRRWTEAGQLQDAGQPMAWVLLSVGDAWLAAGVDGVGEGPEIWASADLSTWAELIQDRRQGGVLGLAASVQGEVVVFGSAPELDRFFLVKTT